MKPIIIFWIDSTSRDSWDSFESHLDGGHLIKSCGFDAGVVGEFRVLILNVDTESGDASQSIRIPIGCIKRVIELI